VGATFFTLIPELLRAGGGWRYALFALFIIGFMAWRPQGLVTPALGRALARAVGGAGRAREVRP